MGKIQGRPYTPKEEDDDEEPSDERPAFEREDDEIPEIEDEGESIDLEEEEEEETEEEEAEETPAYTFKTQKELDDYVASKAKVTAPATQPKKEEPADGKDPVDDLVFFKGYRDKDGKWQGEAPADWNDFARTIIKHLDPKKQAPVILDEIRNMTKKEQGEIQSINDEFDVEYDELAAQKLVPKRGTKEGDAINASISSIGAKYGQTSIKAAYQLWKDLPKEKGGGFGTTLTKKVNPSKQVAGLIRSSKTTNSAKPNKTKIPYSKLHNARSVDELMDEE